MYVHIHHVLTYIHVHHVHVGSSISYRAILMYVSAANCIMLIFYVCVWYYNSEVVSCVYARANC